MIELLHCYRSTMCSRCTRCLSSYPIIYLIGHYFEHCSYFVNQKPFSALQWCWFWIQVKILDFVAICLTWFFFLQFYFWFLHLHVSGFSETNKFIFLFKTWCFVFIVCRGVSTFPLGNSLLKMKIKWPPPNLLCFRDFQLEAVCVLLFAEKRKKIFWR